MIKLNSKEVSLIYEKIVKKIYSLYLNDKLEEALKLIIVSSKWAYHLNFIYSDEKIDFLLKSISHKIFKEGEIQFKPIEGRVVLIDTNGSDNHGLTQQYIRGLISSNLEFAYIYLDSDLSRIKDIKIELANYSKATFFSFDRSYSNIEKIRLIYDFVLQYKPSHYLMHIMPWDVVSMAISSVLKSCKTYNINATDHTYWLGSTLIDYCIEFRDYGSSISIFNRQLKSTQILMLPYYPIHNQSKFLGFPLTEITNPVNIFSGGAIYKIAGENHLFLDILKEIVTRHSNVVIYFASGGNKDFLSDFIKVNKLEDRIILLENRNDIFQVFENIDIYLGTYPISGGLMSQYASVNSKPILAYSDSKFPLNNIEDIICHNTKIYGITKHSINEFYNYADLLINQPKFRKSEGDKLSKCVISVESFNKELSYIISNGISVRNFNVLNIEIDHISSLYLDVENSFYPTAQVLLFREFKFHTFFLSKKVFLNMLIFILKKYLNKIIKL